jgi:hypothetical protein
VLIAQGVLKARALGEAVARQLGLAYCDLRQEPPPASLLRRMPAHLVREYSAVPVRRASEPDRVVVAFANPLDPVARRAAGTALGEPVEPVVTSEADIAWVLETLLR